MKRIAFSALAVLCLLQAGVRANLITNGDFSEGGDKPTGWSVVASEQKVSLEKVDDRTALKVEIVKEGGSSMGEIRQTMKVKKNTKYRVSADLKSTKPGLLLVQVKPRAARKELDRINSATSKADWETVTKEFNSGEADEVQVLCRFNQKEAFVGASGWFSKLVLDELDADGKVVETKPAAASGGGKAPAAPVGPTAPAVAKAGTDQYVTVDGAGDKSGKDLANARSATDLQAAIDAAGPGNTVYIGSGEYQVKGLKVAAGGSGPDGVLTITGKDTGAGLPLFKSNFNKDNPEKSGITLFFVNPGVQHLTIKDIKAEKIRMAVVLKGSNDGVKIENVDVTESRDAIWVEGPSKNIVVKDCDIKLYTKKAARFFGGVQNVQVTNCHVDAGGRDWAVEVFPTGFQVGTKGAAPDSHITFTDCTAANNWHVAGPDKYWNADGFCAESMVSDLTFIRCVAYGNTDGGWDVKAARAKFIDCIAIANKRNFRVWPDPGADGTTFENCLSAYAIDYGERGHQVGIWIKAGGDVTLKNVTSWADPVGIKVENPSEQPQKTVVRLEKCLIDAKTLTSLADGTDLQNDGSVLQKAEEETQAKVKQPSNAWRGGDEAFDCTTQPGLGYRHSARSKLETTAANR